MPITALGVACAVCLFLGVRQEQQRATERAVCAEVVMNYEKHSPMQVLSSHYADVQAALNRLDFSIMPANSRILEAYRLVGGRHCSIQGCPLLSCGYRTFALVRNALSTLSKQSGRCRTSTQRLTTWMASESKFGGKTMSCLC
jgi:anti-sigma factor RsiW